MTGQHIELLDQISEEDRTLGFVLGLWNKPDTGLTLLGDLLRDGHVTIADQSDTPIEPWQFDALHRDPPTLEQARDTHTVSITPEGSDLLE